MALLLVALPLLAATCLCAAVYLVVHDDLLAALIKRQSDIQYAYEDRIAALESRLETRASAAPVAIDVPNGAVRALAALGARLEVRAAALERLASNLGSGAFVGAPTLRHEGKMETGALETRLGPFADRRLDAVAASFSHAEATEAAAARRLRAPMLERLTQIDAALAATGLPPSRWREPGGQAALGGPFVPLSDETSLETSIALLDAAAREQDRLDHVVDAIPMLRPLDGPLEVTSPFGPRIDPFLGRAALHTGIDLREEVGDAVMATAAGEVTIAGPEGGYGNLVEIDHGGGLVTRYGHLSAIEVVRGQHVATHAIIGRVGATGRATGPHLHYETRIDGQPVDPARFLRAAAILSPPP